MYALQKLKQQSLESLGCGAKENELSKPPEGMGELSFSGAFRLSKEMGKTPKEVADSLYVKLKAPELVREIKSAGPYVNFYVDYSKFSELVLDEAGKSDYGKGEKKNETVLIEHTSVNPSGPIHVGRFRNPILGDAIARMHLFQGYGVHVQNYINDVGKQIAIISWAKEKGVEPRKDLEEKWKEYKGKADFETFFLYVPANELVKTTPEMEKEVDELLMKCEAGDEASLGKLKKTAEYCLEGQKQVLERCGFKYDEFVFESSFIRDKSVEKVTKMLKALPESKKLDNGAYALDLSNFGITKEEGTVFQRANGTSVYLTRDVCFHLTKLAKYAKSINILGEDHRVEGDEIITILDLMKQDTKKHKIVFFSFVNLGEGRKMSTRAGETMPLDAVIEEGVRRALAEIEKKNPSLPEEEKKKIAEAVGVGAIKHYIVKTEPSKGIVFEWEKALDFNGDTGPYLQYAYVRCKSILKKAEKKEYSAPSSLSREEQKLVMKIAEFPEIARTASEKCEPHMVAQYLMTLVHDYSAFYEACKVIGSEEEAFRIRLVEATANTLKNGLSLLGIEVVEEM